MSDLRFDDVVDTGPRITGPDGRYAKATCKSCSSQQHVTKDEFRLDNLYNLDGSRYLPQDVDMDMVEYVAAMRAWHCCHEGEEPLDGFPEQPEPPSGIDFEEP